MLQCNFLLRKLFFTGFSFSRYTTFKVNFNQTLQFFFLINLSQSWPFLNTLLALCPLTSALWLWIFEKDREKGASVENQIILSLGASYLMILIFVIHLRLATCQKAIHAPGRILIHLSGRKTVLIWNFRLKLKVANDILALHTETQIGFTYGNIGIVSMANFLTVNGGNNNRQLLIFLVLPFSFL